MPWAGLFEPFRVRHKKQKENGGSTPETPGRCPGLAYCSPSGCSEEAGKDVGNDKRVALGWLSEPLGSTAGRKADEERDAPARSVRALFTGLFEDAARHADALHPQSFLAAMALRSGLISTIII